MRPAALLIGAHEVGTDNVATLVGDEYFVTAGEPIVERLFARKVARQSIGFPAADGRLQDAPDRIMVASFRRAYRDWVVEHLNPYPA